VLASLFLKGALIGLSIAAPVGPIGVLCIRRSLAHGRAVGLATGLGAATADGFYGAVAAFGLTALSSFLLDQQLWLALLGGLFLCWLGVRTFMARPAPITTSTAAVGLASAYASTFVLTLTNPMTILSFVAIFAGIGLGDTRRASGAAIVVLGVFLGSAAWWLLLSFGTSSVRLRLDDQWMRVINRASGAVITAFGIYALSTALRTR
jgi:threonine/homoserine/homoserine lactone efflux protein